MADRVWAVRHPAIMPAPLQVTSSGGRKGRWGSGTAGWLAGGWFAWAGALRGTGSRSSVAPGAHMKTTQPSISAFCEPRTRADRPPRDAHNYAEQDGQDEHAQLIAHRVSAPASALATTAATTAAPCPSPSRAPGSAALWPPALARPPSPACDAFWKPSLRRPSCPSRKFPDDAW